MEIFKAIGCIIGLCAWAYLGYRFVIAVKDEIRTGLRRRELDRQADAWRETLAEREKASRWW